MKIPAWGYILVGLIVAIFSGFIYKSVPKNGEPNMSMAFFFFVGMVFILIGIAKLFFRRIEKSGPMIIEKQSHSEKNAHMNRVEAHINKVYSQNQGKQEHSSNYAQAHPFHKNEQAQQTHHAQAQHNTANTQTQHHMASQHIQHTALQHGLAHNPQSTHQPQTAHHLPYAIVQCPKCSTKNYTHSNYCHNCGHRLR
jgi:hypothetical protein